MSLADEVVVHLRSAIDGGWPLSSSRRLAVERIDARDAAVELVVQDVATGTSFGWRWTDIVEDPASPEFEDAQMICIQLLATVGEDVDALGHGLPSGRPDAVTWVLDTSA